jgi:hypothetical protein
MKIIALLAAVMVFLVGPTGAAEPACTFRADSTTCFVSAEWLPIGDEESPLRRTM